MSKIIKPHEKEVFCSVKKFEQKSLASNARRIINAGAPGNPPMAPKNNPNPRRVTQQASPKDLTAECEREAEQIVREAKQRAAQVRQQARKQGRAEGLKEAKEKIEEQLRVSSQLLESFIGQMKAQEAELMQLLTPRLADLAAELAQKIIHKEIEANSSVVTSQAEEAISKILEREKLIIRVNPADEELMKQHKAALMKMFDGIEKIEVIGDTNIERGGCIVETNLIRVDAQPSSQLGAARRTLLGEIEK
ncbi:MAG: hypothetical protein JSV16_03680 [Candidatus Hydrogenedentota bacterium]|nr:MAG: hypothetical protein JSV16_03680 [Candidatus Hydrogenedentota bacterium]